MVKEVELVEIRYTTLFVPQFYMCHYVPIVYISNFETYTTGT